MTVEELVQGCVRKDHNAWREFVAHYKGLAYKSVRYKLARLNQRLAKSEVNDIVQEIFLFIWEKDKLAGINNISALKSWLAMVSINAASNYCRRRAFRTSSNMLSLEEDNTALISPKLNTECMVNRNEVFNIVQTEISKLDAKKQLALKLNIYHGKKYRDISRIINVPETTVINLLSRAKKRIRRNLKKGFGIRCPEDVLHFF